MEYKATGANRQAVQPVAQTSASKAKAKAESKAESRSAFTFAAATRRPGGFDPEASSTSLSSRRASVPLGAALAKLKALACELGDVRPEAIPTRSVGQATRLLQAPSNLPNWDRIDQLVTAWIDEVVRYENPSEGSGPAEVVLPAAMVDALFELLACMDDERRHGLLACGLAALRKQMDSGGAELQLSPATETALVDGLLATCVRHAQDACVDSRCHPPALRDMDVRSGDSRVVRHLAQVIRESGDPAAHLARVAGRIARIDPPLHPVVLQRLVASVAAGVFAAKFEECPEPQALAAFTAPLLAMDDRLPLRALVHAGLGLAGETVDGPWQAGGRAKDLKSVQKVLEASTQVFMRALLAGANGVGPARLGAMVMAMVHVQQLGLLPSASGLGESAVIACVDAIVRADPPCTPAQRIAMAAAIGRELVPQGRKASNFAAIDRLLAQACRQARERLGDAGKDAIGDIQRGWQLALDPASALGLDGWDERARFDLLELLLVLPGRIEEPQAALQSIAALKLDAAQEWMRSELVMRLASGTRLDLELPGWRVLHQALLSRLHEVQAVPGMDDEAVVETKAGRVAKPAPAQEAVVRPAVARWGLEEMAAYCAAFEDAHGLPGPGTDSAACDFAKRLARAEGLLQALQEAS